MGRKGGIVRHPDWLEVSRPIAGENGQAVVLVTVRTDRRAFWAEMLRTAWAEYGAYWWHPAFWVLCIRFAWSYARAS